MLIHAGTAFLVTLVSAASSTTDQSDTNVIPSDTKSIIVTAITTLGVILVALISSRRNKRNGNGAPPASPPVGIHSWDDATKTASRLAVLEYRADELDERVGKLEAEQLRRGAHRGT